MLRVLASNIDEVSYYDYGEKIVTIPLTFITVLSTVMMPRIANEFKKENMSVVNNLLSRAAGFSLMLAFPMMFGMMICAPKLIPWYLGESYNSTIGVIICISPMIVTNALASISGNQYFVATNQTNIILKAYVSAAVVNIVSNLLLIPRLNCLGAGIATVISATVSVIIQYYYMNKQIGIMKVIQYGVRYLFLVLPMAIVIFFIGINRNAIISTTVIQVIIGVISYLGTLLIVKDENMKSLIKKIIWIGKK
jgi:O-antigen/teichoic acid export membrane protein